MGIAALDAHVRNTNPPTPTASATGEPTTQPSAGPSNAGLPPPAALFFPDPALHPGAINTGLGASQLCDPAFRTRSIRPPVSYTSKLKQLELDGGGSIKAPSGATYVVEGENLPGTVADYELDHLISLELGGNPEDPKNLWMQPWEKRGAHFAPSGEGAESKDVVENRLHREVCAGTISLTDAQREIASDWTAAR
jgi:hypothetical protein